MKLAHQLGQLRLWQQGNLRQLAHIPSWLKQQGLLSTSTGLVIEQAIEAVRDDKVTIAVAGDCARGKTELLNALFFSDLGGRLLPTHGEHSNLCPTVIEYDPRIPPRLSLLSVASRGSEHTLDALRADPSSWLHLALAIDDPDSLSGTLGRVAEQLVVSRQQAVELGFDKAAAEASGDEVMIPRWRLAELNLPHPTLCRGLRILDTPGLQGIANEPSLAPGMLAAADAILFVVGADTGVTQSDLAMWRRFVCGPAFSHDAALSVVLNKTDRLWMSDDRPQQVAATIVGQCRMAARRLGVEEQQVFAVSAQKALVARCRQDAELELRSGILDLESQVGLAVAANRKQRLHHGHIGRVRQRLTDIRDDIAASLANDSRHLEDLRDLTERSDDEIQRRLQAARGDYRHIHRHAQRYRRNADLFRHASRQMLNQLDPSGLEILFARARADMDDAWTTQGQRKVMRDIIDEINHRLLSAGSRVRRIRRFTQATYRHFSFRLQTDIAPPRSPTMLLHQVRLCLLIEQAEHLRNSPRLTLMHQRQVTQLYFEDIVGRALELMAEAFNEYASWVEGAMSPLSEVLDSRKQALRNRVQDLQTAAASRITVQQGLESLRRDNAAQQRQVTTLTELCEQLDRQSGVAAELASGQN
jgi:hypothetical protein